MDLQQTIADWLNSMGRAVRRTTGRPTLAQRLAPPAAPGAPLGGPLQPSGQGVLYANAAGDRPRLTVLSIDGSPSMLEKDWLPNRLAGAQHGAIEYVTHSAQANPLNEAAVVVYAERARVVCPWTPCVDAATFTRSISKIGTSNWTNITAGLEAAEKLLASVPDLGGWELLVHLLTDGWHNCGGTPGPAADRLKALGVIIDVVGIGGNRGAVDERLLTDLASVGPDGVKRYRFIGDPQRLVQHYRTIAGRLTR